MPRNRFWYPGVWALANNSFNCCRHLAFFLGSLGWLGWWWHIYIYYMMFNIIYICVTRLLETKMHPISQIIGGNLRIFSKKSLRFSQLCFWPFDAAVWLHQHGPPPNLRWWKGTKITMHFFQKGKLFLQLFDKLLYETDWNYASDIIFICICICMKYVYLCM